MPTGLSPLAAPDVRDVHGRDAGDATQAPDGALVVGVHVRVYAKVAGMADGEGDPIRALLDGRPVDLDAEARQRPRPRPGGMNHGHRQDGRSARTLRAHARRASAGTTAAPWRARQGRPHHHLHRSLRTDAPRLTRRPAQRPELRPRPCSPSASPGPRCRSGPGPGRTRDRYPDRALRSGLGDLLANLAPDRSADHEIDLLLAGTPVTVGATATGPHPPSAKTTPARLRARRCTTAGHRRPSTRP